MIIMFCFVLTSCKSIPSADDNSGLTESLQPQMHINELITPIPESDNIDYTLLANYTNISVGTYVASYQKVHIYKDIPDEMLGEPYRNAGITLQSEYSLDQKTEYVHVWDDQFYHVSSHDDLQYLIRETKEGRSLWRFNSFDYRHLGATEEAYLVCVPADEIMFDEILSLIYPSLELDGLSRIQFYSQKDHSLPIKNRDVHSLDDADFIALIYDYVRGMTPYQGDPNLFGLTGDPYSESAQIASDEDTPIRNVLYDDRNQHISIILKNGSSIDNIVFAPATNQLCLRISGSLKEFIFVTTINDEDIAEFLEMLSD